MENKEREKALNGFKNVLSAIPKHVQCYGNIGICYTSLGQKQKALETFDKALELDPTYTPAIENRKLTSALKEGEQLADVGNRNN